VPRTGSLFGNPGEPGDDQGVDLARCGFDLGCRIVSERLTLRSRSETLPDVMIERAAGQVDALVIFGSTEFPSGFSVVVRKPSCARSDQHVDLADADLIMEGYAKRSHLTLLTCDALRQPGFA